MTVLDETGYEAIDTLGLKQTYIIELVEVTEICNR